MSGKERFALFDALLSWRLILWRRVGTVNLATIKRHSVIVAA